MDARDTQKYYKKYPLSKGILYGAVGGLVAAWVMAPFLMITMILIGAPQEALFTALGGYFIISPIESSFQTGLIMHMVSGVIIGAIFGAITATIQRLRITSFAKGVGEGLAAGGMIFAVFFVPLVIATLPSIVEAMIQNEDVTEGQRSDLEADIFAAIILLGAFDHLAYGAVLGVVTSAFVVGVRKIPKVEK